jgi:primary-amine oxidase
MMRIGTPSTCALLVICISLATSAAEAQRQAPPDPKVGNKVEWRGWTFNWSIRQREGLVITDVYYQNRKVLKYAGLAEILTTYDQGDPRILDIDDEGLGARKLAIKAGIDCSSGEWCKQFDSSGKEQGAKGADDSPRFVMLHEEKTGPNYLGEFGRVPGRTLTLWMASHFPGPPDGYTFIVRWKFRDDGALIPEIGATGVPQHLDTGDTSPTGALIGVDENLDKVFAPAHIHHFLYRLDFDVDGPANIVEEFNRERDADVAGRREVRSTWTPITRETGRPCNPETFRSWRVINPESKNALGHPRSYQLIPGNTGIFHSGRKAGFPEEAGAEYELWVTRYKPDEFPRGRDDPRTAIEALPKYANNEDVTAKDVVLWYWIGYHHFPRSEDWLHQPIIWKSFELIPRDFLDASPLKPEE